MQIDESEAELGFLVALLSRTNQRHQFGIHVAARVIKE
jgi:hypothetical protein